ncbi:restriction endonuclease subunit S [Vibrio chagasii]|uniref:restriction endonuclease subunit S n=1 Tax=Vibrio chagasii TaxID=170679 RepID=UPI002283D796|nr:restriction endonuclease subunit S [Vibrio chagasii]MCY9829339.1 restriction endonuclease subunit S [Vibrio chagasii]
MSQVTSQVVPDGYKQTEVGIIPNDWASLTLDDVCCFVGGAQPEKSTFSYKQQPDYIRLIQIRDYKSDKNTVYIPEKLARKKCDENDIMIGRYGPPIFQILRGIEGAYNVALIKAIPASCINREFLYYILKDEQLFELMDTLSQRSSGQTGVDLPALKAYPIGLPSEKEQTAIATALSDVDALLDALEKLIAKKQAIKTATMQQLLTGKTRLPQFSIYADVDKQGQIKGTKSSELGEIPEDWDVARMGDISNVNQGLQIEIEQRKSYQSEISKPYITIQSLKLTEPTEFIDEYSSAVCCVEDEILMTRTGNTGIVVTGVTGVFHNNFFKIVYQKSKLNKDFFVCFLRSSDSKKRILDKAGTSTIPDLNHNDFYSLPIILPSKKEQTAIAAILTDMDKEIQALQQRLSKTRQIKQGMMQELLTGKTRLPFDKTNMKFQGESHAD